jgi:alpha-1,2-mannosyltransferase
VVAPSAAASSPAAWRRGRLALDGWAALVWIAVLAQIVARIDAYEWDFAVYWSGARTMLSGQSPYGPIAGLAGYLRFVYPPLAAFLFVPFAGLGLGAAKVAWLLIKLAALAVTVRLWLRATAASDANRPPAASMPRAPLFFVISFAFGSAAFIDVTAGNVAIIEQLLLWIGIVALLARRRWIFVLFVVLAAQCKLTPIFFLGLLLVVDERPRWGAFVAGVALFVATLAANIVVYPAASREFLALIRSMHDHGWADPAMLGLMQDAAGDLRALHLPVAGTVAYVGYGAVVVGVVCATIRWWRAHRASGAPDRLRIVLVTLALYALVMPRMKDYSYVALLPAAWYVLTRFRTREVALVAIAVLVPRPLPQTHIVMPFVSLAYTYAPLLAAAVVWWCLIRDDDEASETQRSAAPATQLAAAASPAS